MAEMSRLESGRDENYRELGGSGQYPYNVSNGKNEEVAKDRKTNQRLCRYHLSPYRCRKGLNCIFSHDSTNLNNQRKDRLQWLTIEVDHDSTKAQTNNFDVVGKFIREVAKLENEDIETIIIRCFRSNLGKGIIKIKTKAEIDVNQNYAKKNAMKMHNEGVNWTLTIKGVKKKRNVWVRIYTPGESVTNDELSKSIEKLGPITNPIRDEKYEAINDLFNGIKTGNKIIQIEVELGFRFPQKITVVGNDVIIAPFSGTSKDSVKATEQPVSRIITTGGRQPETYENDEGGNLNSQEQ